MARLPRLVLPAHAHHVVLRGTGDRPVFADELDRDAFVAALLAAGAATGVAVQAFALHTHEAQLLLTPPLAASLSRCIQALGRAYVPAHNRRHGRSGSVWDGRFRCAVVEPGDTRLAVLCLIDGGWLDGSEAPRTSAPHRLGGPRLAGLDDPPEYWALGNTPFEREAAYRELLADRHPGPEQAARLRRAALGGWAAGSAAFAEQVAALSARPARPRPRGRPRRGPQPG